MADSLRDQLLKSGLVQKLKAQARPAERPPARGPKPDRASTQSTSPRPGTATPSGKPQADRGQRVRPQRSQEEIDLARAYALRDRAEREEREQVKRDAEQRAREKAERKQKLAALLKDRSLNLADADVARHFQHGEKIRRVYCSAAQLLALNKGELVVVQHLGRYLLVTGETGEQVRLISPEALVLVCDPDAPAEDDIPPDLIW